MVSKSSGQSPDAALLLDIIDDIGVKVVGNGGGKIEVDGEDG